MKANSSLGGFDSVKAACLGLKASSGHCEGMNSLLQGLSALRTRSATGKFSHRRLSEQSDQSFGDENAEPTGGGIFAIPHSADQESLPLKDSNVPSSNGKALDHKQKLYRSGSQRQKALQALTQITNGALLDPVRHLQRVATCAQCPCCACTQGCPCHAAG